MRIAKRLLATLTLTCTLLIPSVSSSKEQLHVYTYATFTEESPMVEALRTGFEASCNCELILHRMDSSIAILTRVQLEGAKTQADVIMGLDQNLIGRAKASKLFAEHGLEQSRLNLPVSWDDDIFIPFDWSYFAFVYDSREISNPPKSMSQLIDAAEDFKIVLQDPRSSTPGFGLLLWIKSIYGDEAEMAWRRLSPRVLSYTKDWWESYSMFLQGEGEMVLSYVTSPDFHRIVEQNDYIRAADFEEGHYLQIEVAAILKHSRRKELAKQFLEFIQGDQFQALLPTGNWMYPVKDIPQADQLTSPSSFTERKLIPSDEVFSNQREWLGEWLRAVTP